MDFITENCPQEVIQKCETNEFQNELMTIVTGTPKKDPEPPLKLMNAHEMEFLKHQEKCNKLLHKQRALEHKNKEIRKMRAQEFQEHKVQIDEMKATKERELRRLQELEKRIQDKELCLHEIRMYNMRRDRDKNMENLEEMVYAWKHHADVLQRDLERVTKRELELYKSTLEIRNIVKRMKVAMDDYYVGVLTASSTAGRKDEYQQLFYLIRWPEAATAEQMDEKRKNFENNLSVRDWVVYNGGGTGWERMQIIAIHKDDPEGTYYTLRSDDGKERQTDIFHMTSEKLRI